MQRLKNQSGTTLVELIVCMVLLALFTLAAVTLIQPSAQAYMDIQQQTRAQNLADALIETIRGEVMDANGYIRFTNGDETGSNLDTVFAAQSSYSDGTALEFSIYPNHIELIDKDCVPGNLQKEDGTVLLTDAQAKDLNGYLHMRFYRDTRIDGKYGNPQHSREAQQETGAAAIPYMAYGYTTAYAKDAYMGLFISDLHFYARSWTQEKATDTPRITAMTVVLTVSKENSDGTVTPLCTQKAIVPLPGAPVILYTPGTWDGSASTAQG